MANEKQKNFAETINWQNPPEESVSIPSKYENMPSEMVEEMWPEDMSIDEKKRGTKNEQRRKAIEKIREEELAREEGKKKMYHQLFSSLPENKRAVFAEHQQKGVDQISEYITGKKSLSELSGEEQYALGKLQIAYQEFQEENPGKSFLSEGIGDVDKQVLENLQYRLAFDSLRIDTKQQDEQKVNKILDSLHGGKTETARDDLAEEKDLDYLKERVRGAYEEVRKKYKGANLIDATSYVAHGLRLEDDKPYDQVDPKIGAKFDAHGIAKLDQLETLLKLLDSGVDKNRDFHSAPFEADTKDKAGLGAGLGTAGGTALKNGIAVVTSGFGEQIVKNGIKHVFLNDVYSALKDPLEEMYPQYKIHLLSEQKRVMEDETNAK